MNKSPQSLVLGFVNFDIRVDIVGGVGIGHIPGCTLVGFDIVVMFGLMLVVSRVELGDLVRSLDVGHLDVGWSEGVGSEDEVPDLLDLTILIYCVEFIPREADRGAYPDRPQHGRCGATAPHGPVSGTCERYPCCPRRRMTKWMGEAQVVLNISLVKLAVTSFSQVVHNDEAWCLVADIPTRALGGWRGTPGKGAKLYPGRFRSVGSHLPIAAQAVLSVDMHGPHASCVRFTCHALYERKDGGHRSQVGGGAHPRADRVLLVYTVG